MINYTYDLVNKIHSLLRSWGLAPLLFRDAFLNAILQIKNKVGIIEINLKCGKLVLTKNDIYVIAPAEGSGYLFDIVEKYSSEINRSLRYLCYCAAKTDI